MFSSSIIRFLKRCFTSRQPQNLTETIYSPSKPIKIDRLSSLPPELLSIIFDLAHDPDRPLYKPLSRTLYPYTHLNLYRRITLSSGPSLLRLLAAVKRTPSLALLVHDLRFTFFPDMAGVEFEAVARPFTALKSLEYGVAQFSDLNSVPIAPLQSLSYSPSFFNPDEIDALSRLPLIKLVLDFTCTTNELSDNFQPAKMMPTLEELTLVDALSEEDRYQWDPMVARFVKSCPELRSLKLVDEESPRFEKFLEALVGGVPLLTITKLDFDTPALPDLTICRFTHLYPRFPNLTFLGLGLGTTSPNLASHLRQLSSLETLSLGPDAHFGFESAENLFSLVRASTKPPALELLIFLECFGPTMGYRCNVQDELLWANINDPHYRKEEWNPPNFSDCIGQQECRQLLELAKETGVRVEGDIYAAIDYGNSSNLELANRHVLYAFQNQTLQLLKAFNNSLPGARFRELNVDIDKLDRNNLKLVKIDFPEEDWYQFTLE
ncbi:hypothetical protein JCM5350_002755 [Sporobolomyces pararoseus]